MPKIAYTTKNFRDATLALIRQANAIIAEYQSAGFSLTLRQLYYQMVARAIIPNRQQEYKRLGQIINNARLAGLVDWNAIVDRTRNLRENPHWCSPREIMQGAVDQYQMDKWRDQDFRLEAWIEKDALVGVIAGICRELDIAYFSCRGYASASEVWRAGQRLARYKNDGQDPIVLHLGDHDPSGVDMTRDIEGRLSMFGGWGITVKRIALNMDQIEQYNPPPNPAKITDSRFNGYAIEFGEESWELDALEPQVLVELIRDEIFTYRDPVGWAEKVALENEHRAILRQVTDDVAREHGF